MTKQSTATFSKQEKLQALINAHTTEDHYQFTAVFRKGRGWYAVPDEPRHLGDRGTYLGWDYDEAQKGVLDLLG